MGAYGWAETIPLSQTVFRRRSAGTRGAVVASAHLRGCEFALEGRAMRARILKAGGASKLAPYGVG